MTERIVVGAALLDGARLLAARRSAPAELAGRWELPGGKVEEGESPDARPGERVPGRWPLKPPYVLHVWTATLLPGSAAPAPLEDHDALRWLTPGEIWDVPWLAADVPAVRATLAHLGPEPAGGPPGG
jgi:8-oxo-dGTP diphosphatase